MIQMISKNAQATMPYSNHFFILGFICNKLALYKRHELENSNYLLLYYFYFHLSIGF